MAHCAIQKSAVTCAASLHTLRRLALDPHPGGARVLKMCRQSDRLALMGSSQEQECVIVERFFNAQVSSSDSTLPIEVGPFAGLNKAGPIIWMRVRLALQHLQLRSPEGF